MDTESAIRIEGTVVPAEVADAAAAAEAGRLEWGSLDGLFGARAENVSLYEACVAAYIDDPDSEIPWVCVRMLSILASDETLAATTRLAIQCVDDSLDKYELLTFPITEANVFSPRQLLEVAWPIVRDRYLESVAQHPLLPLELAEGAVKDTALDLAGMRGDVEHLLATHSETIPEEAVAGLVGALSVLGLREEMRPVVESLYRRHRVDISNFGWEDLRAEVPGLPERPEFRTGYSSIYGRVLNLDTLRKEFLIEERSREMYTELRKARSRPEYTLPSDISARTPEVQRKKHEKREKARKDQRKARKAARKRR